MGKFPTKAALNRRIGLISWPHALCLASRDACQASNSIFAEKTSIQRRGKRPSFPRMVNSPRETRVAKKTRHNWGVNECLAFSMPSQSLSGPFLTPQAPHYACPRDTRAQDPLFAPETIARRCGDHPSSIWMEDPPRITRDARKHIVRQWERIQMRDARHA